MDSNIMFALLVGVLAGAVLMVFVTERVKSRQRALAYQKQYDKDHDPFLISALEFTNKERKMFGAHTPDPDEIVMHVRFTVSENAGNYAARETVNETLSGTWEVHANGKMVPATTTFNKEEELVLDDDFYGDAVHYFNLPPDSRECSFSPPHMHVLDTVVRLIWHKGNWYLNGIDDSYRLAVHQIRLAVARDLVGRVIKKTVSDAR